MQQRIYKLSLILSLLLINSYSLAAQTPQTDAPLTSQELVKLVYQLPKHPEKRDEVVAEIRRRGIGFELTNGMRGLVATKSGNDELLNRTLEEAERRRANPTTAARPPAPEADALLEQARKTTLAAAGGMPDFVVKQLITRSSALGTTHSWNQRDRLTVAVSYRESEGEKYKLLAVNGLPADAGTIERNDYNQAGGATSTGEFVSRLITLFDAESQTHFQFADTDTLRGRRALVFEYETKKEHAQARLVWAEPGAERATNIGLRGRVWIDRETARVLRLEYISTEVDPDFPIKQTESSVDYDWVTIAGKQYLLPVAANIVFTSLAPVRLYDSVERKVVERTQLVQDRNDIHFRNYQKFGTEVKILEEDDFPVEEQPKKPE
ncbi:MAG: hypothetical protein DMF64_20910 [Acidobacteria bacterium]|nr:MAG: hypothetical protein DMF64_20910 [Acidobacteriota bacterium]